MEENSGEQVDKDEVLSGKGKKCEQQTDDVFAEVDVKAW